VTVTQLHGDESGLPAGALILMENISRLDTDAG
jgi:hypothetical protein